MKTPEDMDKVELLAASYACDYRDSPSKTNGVPDSYLVYSVAYDGFLAGYKAAKDEEVAKDQKIAELWTESIKNMLPSVHEITLFPSKLKEDK